MPRRPQAHSSVLITFTVTGDDTLVDHLAAMAGRVQDLRPVWPVLAERFARNERTQFATFGRGRWRPLNPTYAGWKIQHYGARPLMVLTGELFSQLTTRPFGVYVMEPHFARFGTTAREGRFAQGGKGDAGHQPRRRIVTLGAAERRIWAELMGHYIFRGEVG